MRLNFHLYIYQRGISRSIRKKPVSLENPFNIFSQENSLDKVHDRLILIIITYYLFTCPKSRVINQPLLDSIYSKRTSKSS